MIVTFRVQIFFTNIFEKNQNLYGWNKQKAFLKLINYDLFGIVKAKNLKFGMFVRLKT